MPKTYKKSENLLSLFDEESSIGASPNEAKTTKVKYLAAKRFSDDDILLLEKVEEPARKQIFQSEKSSENVVIKSIESEEPPKRPRGRPKKNTTDNVVAAPVAPKPIAKKPVAPVVPVEEVPVKRRPGRPKKSESIAPTIAESQRQPKRMANQLVFDTSFEENNLVGKTEETEPEVETKSDLDDTINQRRRSRKEWFVDSEEVKKLMPQEKETAQIISEDPPPVKRGRGRPRKDGTFSVQTSHEKINPNDSIAEKVRKMKGKRGRRKKNAPLIIVVSKDENKKPIVSEQEKAVAISSIKDAISSSVPTPIAPTHANVVDPIIVPPDKEITLEEAKAIMEKTYMLQNEPVQSFKPAEAPKPVVAPPPPVVAPARPKINEPMSDAYTIAQSKSLTYDEKQDILIKQFLDEIEKFLIHEMYVDRTSKILIAVSGGVDSMVLLDVMAILADKYKFTLFVSHYNHNLRGDASDGDQNFVQKATEAYNIPFYVAGGKVRSYAEKNGISIEQAARFLRYSFLERTSRNLNADFVATAHTADDSAETFLMNMLRGSGLTGLSGIPFRRQFVKDVLLIRPFINVKKSTLIRYAKLRNIQWREDETNTLQNYTRNKIRHDLIPKLANDYNPAIIDIINRTAKLMQGADRIIHSQVRTNLPTVLQDIHTDRFSIKLPIFQTFDRFIQGEMIQSALMKYLRVQPPALRVIDKVVALQDAEIGTKCDVTKTITAIKDRGTIVIMKKQYMKEVNMVIDRVGKFKVGNVVIVLKEMEKRKADFSKNPNVEYFDFDMIPPALYIRTWVEGDTFQPLGMKGSMKISDFLTNEKVAFVDRQNVLVLATKNDVAWVIGKRISHKFRVTEETEKVLRVEVRFSEKF